jgi:hypothetical protein
MKNPQFSKPAKAKQARLVLAPTVARALASFYIHSPAAKILLSITDKKAAFVMAVEITV